MARIAIAPFVADIARTAVAITIATIVSDGRAYDGAADKAESRTRRRSTAAAAANLYDVAWCGQAARRDRRRFSAGDKRPGDDSGQEKCR